MKKILVIALALVALASCTKKTLTPVELNQEVTYQTAIGAISTKASPTFDTAWGFVSYAHQHQNELAVAEVPTNKLNGQATWTNAGINATYIKDEKISHQTNMWKGATTYYWPKASYLTFYAWSDLKNKPATIDGTGKDNPTYTTTNGITVTGYEITGESEDTIANRKNMNKDFAVAEVAYNKTANETSSGEWLNGVPTIFHHQLSSFVFNAKTVDKDGNDIDYEAVKDQKHYFYVTKITFKQVYKSANYTQLVENPTTTSSWSSHTGTDNYVMFDASKSPTGAVDMTVAPLNISGITAGTKGIKVSNTATAVALPITDSEFEFLLPQTIQDNENTVVEVEYYAVDKIGENLVGKKYTKTKKLVEAFKKGNVAITEWKQDTKYTLTLGFSLEEILWDPSYDEWTPADAQWNF